MSASAAHTIALVVLGYLQVGAAACHPEPPPVPPQTPTQRVAKSDLSQAPESTPSAVLDASISFDAAERLPDTGPLATR